MSFENYPLSEKVGFTADIHGQDDLFEDLVEDAFSGDKFYDNVPCTKLVVVGDAVDRFYNPSGGLRVLQTIYDNRDRIILLPGNQDRDVAMQRFNTALWQLHKKQWGFQDGELAEMLKNDKNEHLAEMLRHIDLYYEDEHSFAIHAGLHEGSIKATKDELDRILDLSGEYGYITAPIAPIASHVEQESGASDSDKTIVTGHKHYPYDEARAVGSNGFLKRLRVGCQAGSLCLATIHGLAKSIKYTHLPDFDQPILPLD